MHDHCLVCLPVTQGSGLWVLTVIRSFVMGGSYFPAHNPSQLSHIESTLAGEWEVPGCNIQVCPEETMFAGLNYKGTGMADPERPQVPEPQDHE